jgi:hypothetical protein
MIAYGDGEILSVWVEKAGVAVENGKEPTDKAPPATSKAPSIGDVIGQGLVALCVGALLGVLWSYWPQIMRLFK